MVEVLVSGQVLILEGRKIYNKEGTAGEWFNRLPLCYLPAPLPSYRLHLCRAGYQIDGRTNIIYSWYQKTWHLSCFDEYRPYYTNVQKVVTNVRLCYVNFMIAETNEENKPVAKSPCRSRMITLQLEEPWKVDQVTLYKAAISVVRSQFVKRGAAT